MNQVPHKYFNSVNDIILHYRKEKRDMDLREAYKAVIKHQLELIIEDDQTDLIDETNVDSLTQQLHDNEHFLTELQEAVLDHLETFGPNYGLEE